MISIEDSEAILHAFWVRMVRNILRDGTLTELHTFAYWFRNADMWEAL